VPRHRPKGNPPHRSTFHRSLAEATCIQSSAHAVHATDLAPRQNMLPIPTTFSPPRPEVNPRMQSSLSVAGRSHTLYNSLLLRC
jgi:hypothetical protein